MLNLNKDKSSVLLCLRTQTPNNLGLAVPIVKETKVLGVTINDNLTWNTHVSKMISKCNQQFFVMRKLKRFILPSELQVIYEGCIRSCLDYACPSFVALPKTLEDRVERVQRRAFRIINADTSHSDSEPLRPSCSIKERREILSQKLFSKVDSMPSHILHKYIPKKLK
ncbi:MAG: hypothetical protein AAGK05_19385, partial [Pseudomonadota bacterium]